MLVILPTSPDPKLGLNTVMNDQKNSANSQMSSSPNPLGSFIQGYKGAVLYLGPKKRPQFRELPK